jgi:hypothetical protein
MLILPTPLWVQLWDSSVDRPIKVDRENFCKLFNAQRPNSDSNALQETTRVLSICLIDVP